MSLYDERVKIYALLQKNHLDTARFVVGAGETYEKRQSRFVFNASSRQEILDRTAEFAIKYFCAYNVYLVWKISQWTELRTVTRGVFTAVRDGVLHAIQEHSFVQKGAEFHNRGAERVEVLTYEELESFISDLANPEKDENVTEEVQ